MTPSLVSSSPFLYFVPPLNFQYFTEALLKNKFTERPAFFLFSLLVLPTSNLKEFFCSLNSRLRTKIYLKSSVISSFQPLLQVGTVIIRFIHLFKHNYLSRSFCNDFWGFHSSKVTLVKWMKAVDLGFCLCK